MASVAGKAPSVKSGSGSSSTKHTPGVSRFPRDPVRGRLCSRWLDSLIQRLMTTIRPHVTPRQPTSKWSDINRNRWLELRLLAAHVGRSRSGTRTIPKPPRPVVPECRLHRKA